MRLGGGRKGRFALAAVTSLATVSAFTLAGLPARATGLTASIGSQPVQAPLNVNGRHVFWPSNVNTGSATVSPSTYNNLIYHGGAVETAPKVYVVFWGSEWDNTAGPSYNIPATNPGTGADYTLGELQNYITTFFSGVGTTPSGTPTPPAGTGPGTTGAGWNNIQTQYCQGGTIGDVTCGAGTTPVTNPSAVLGGTWVDDTPADAPPQVIATLGLAENLNVALDPVAAEAVRAANKFGITGDPNATVFVYAPPGRDVTGFYPVPYYCGYHTEVQPSNLTNSATGLRYAFIPYLLDIDLNSTYAAVGSCGMNYVNKVNDSAGHGVFDGFSIVSGHEYAEAVTDPDNWPPNVQDGWNDYQTSENGDKCAWMAPGSGTGAATNMFTATTGQYFAVQGLWSNAASGGTGGCAVTY